MLEYLQELDIPDLRQELSVKVNRTNYLPEVSAGSSTSCPAKD